MQKSILVTGATGFIAQQLIIDLLNAGYRVRGTIRDLSKRDNLLQTLSNHTDKANDLALYQADLENDEGWAEAIRGTSCVQHVASPFPLRIPKDPEELIRPAKQGVVRVLKLAKKEEVERVVMTSSCATIAYKSDDPLPAMLTEDDWSDAHDAKACPPYPASKTLAERAAWEYINEEGKGLELAAINPAGVFGPIRSADVRTSVGVVQQLLSGGVPAMPRIGLQFCDVRDVSAMHIKAMETPEAAGHRYAVAGKFLYMEEVANILRDAFPDYAARLPRKTIPDFLVKVLAPFSADAKVASYELDKHRYVSPEKGEALLGRKFIDAEDALIESAKSLILYGAV
ncbi:MAG: aldehyde reductase [Pseudomonadota bacterium]